eukprot:1691285-Prymnesium_polylepis.1
MCIRDSTQQVLPCLASRNTCHVTRPHDHSPPHTEPQHLMRAPASLDKTVGCQCTRSIHRRTRHRAAPRTPSAASIARPSQCDCC